jgi:hypothetical protein
MNRRTVKKISPSELNSYINIRRHDFCHLIAQSKASSMGEWIYLQKLVLRFLTGNVRLTRGDVMTTAERKISSLGTVRTFLRKGT